MWNVPAWVGLGAFCVVFIVAMGYLIGYISRGSQR